VGFLAPALKRGNLEVLPNVRVQRILFEGRRAVGVGFIRSQGGAETVVRARREVIVSAGTANTARLLQISGIGSASLLAKLGVKIVHELPGVGQNLSDHYSARLMMRARQGATTLNEMARGPRLLWQIMRWMARKPGVLTLTPSQVHLFCKSNPGVQTPDLQCVFVPGSYKEGKHYVLDNYPGVTGGWWQHRPLSRGHVHARSTNVFEDPLIQPNYLSHSLDQEVMVAGMKIIRGLLHSPTMAKYLVEETVPGIETQTDEQLLDFCKSHGLSLGRNGTHGAEDRPAFGGGLLAEGSRLRKPAGDRRLRDANNYLRQHLCSHFDDRRKRRRSCARQAWRWLILHTLNTRRRQWPNIILKHASS
jgi:choline dehydrogenase